MTESGPKRTDRGFLLAGAALSLLGSLWLIGNAVWNVVVVAQNIAIPFQVTLPTQKVDTVAGLPLSEHVSGFGVTSVDVLLTGMSPTMQFWLGLSALLEPLGFAVALVSLAVICRRAAMGEVFSSSIRKATVTATGAILFAGIVASTVRLWTARGVVVAAFGPDSGLVPQGGIDVTLVVIGVSMTLGGYALAAGHRLQRDTEGLV